MPSLPDRPASTRGRVATLGGIGLLASVVAALVATIVAVSVQPSFTRLEQAAVVLVPDGVGAQPPVEIVPPLGAFDRSYRVRVTPAGALEIPAVEARAATLGWERTGVDGDVRTYASDGTAATVDFTAGTVTVRIASGVRGAQVVSVATLALLAGVVAVVHTGRRWRRRPRLVRT